MQIAVTSGEPFQLEIIREGTSEYRHRHFCVDVGVCVGIGMSGSVATSSTLPATGGWARMSATRGIDLAVCLRIPPNSALIVLLYL
jgi:hypothetical protein